MADKDMLVPDEPEPAAAREENAAEPAEPSPRGNRYSEPDELPEHDMPPPQPL